MGSDGQIRPGSICPMYLVRTRPGLPEWTHRGKHMMMMMMIWVQKGVGGICFIVGTPNAHGYAKLLIK